MGKTFDRFTNAYWLRGGQVGDLAQAAGNAGYNLRNFASGTASGITGEIQGNNAGAHVVALGDRFKAWIDDYNKPGPDPNPFVII